MLTTMNLAIQEIPYVLMIEPFGLSLSGARRKASRTLVGGIDFPCMATRYFFCSMAGALPSRTPVTLPLAVRWSSMELVRGSCDGLYWRR